MEFSLRRMLLEILECPADVDSHLEFVHEGLYEFESEIEVFIGDKEQSSLYGSQIGKLLVVIRKIVLETYPSHPRTAEIEALVKQLLEKISYLIAKAVDVRLPVFRQPAYCQQVPVLDGSVSERAGDPRVQDRGARGT
jgi:Asp-tRNA(Asn)/Glu-tRNA(Gln) amidotransferase A subunit family amidase